MKNSFIFVSLPLMVNIRYFSSLPSKLDCIPNPFKLYYKVCFRVLNDDDSLYSHLKPLIGCSRLNTKWGVIDFECYVNSDKIFELYAIGISCKAKTL